MSRYKESEVGRLADALSTSLEHIHRAMSADSIQNKFSRQMLHAKLDHELDRLQRIFDADQLRSVQRRSSRQQKKKEEKTQ